MEKDYKVRFYYFGEGPDRILTTTQLLELAGKITDQILNSVDICILL